MSIFGIFKKKEKKSASSSVQTERDRRTYLINGKWVRFMYLIVWTIHLGQKRMKVRIIHGEGSNKYAE